MELQLAYPAMPSCDACEKYTVDAKFWQITFWRGQPFPRKPTDPTPCHLCPKCVGDDEKTPAQGRKAELSAKNKRAIKFYWRVTGAGGRDGLDEVALKNIGIIHEVIRRFELDNDQKQTRFAAIEAAKGG